MAINLGPSGLTLGNDTVSDWSGNIVQAGAIPSLITRGSGLSSTSYTNYKTVTITPQHAGSIIVFQVNWQVFLNQSNGSNYAIVFRIYNNTGGYVLNSSMGSPTGGYNDHDPYTASQSFSSMQRGCGVRYDELNTTSTQTYYLQYAKSDSNRSNTEFSHNSSFNSNAIWFELVD